MTGLKVLFAIAASSHTDSADVQRLLVLKSGLESCGVQTSILYLGDYLLSTPQILLPLNMPHFLRLANGYDVVHATGFAAYAMGIAKSVGTFKLIWDIHGSIEEIRLSKKSRFDIDHTYSLIAWLVAGQVAKKQADFFITVSEPLKRILVQEGIDEGKTGIIYNGVNATLFKPDENRKENEIFTVTYAGAYQEYQGIENFVKAAHLLKDDEVKFKMMGFRRTDVVLKDQIKRELKDRVELIDFMPRNENGQQPKAFVDELCKSDVLVIPRYWNPNIPKYCDPMYVRNTFGWLSTKFAEYIATGRPVIVTTLDVSAEFVEQYDCGFVCDPTPESIANTILEAKQTSIEELNKKGVNGRRLAETEFDVHVIGRRHFELLSKILQS